MAYVRLETEANPSLTIEAKVLGTWTQRLRGLLGTNADVSPVMLTRCRSIHTFGMRYPIDLLFVGRGGEVLECRRGVAPRRVLSCAGALCVIERPSCDTRWPLTGDRLWASAISADGLTG